MLSNEVQLADNVYTLVRQLLISLTACFESSGKRKEKKIVKNYRNAKRVKFMNNFLLVLSSSDRNTRCNVSVKKRNTSTNPYHTYIGNVDKD